MEGCGVGIAEDEDIMLGTAVVDTLQERDGRLREGRTLLEGYELDNDETDTLVDEYKLGKPDADKVADTLVDRDSGHGSAARLGEVQRAQAHVIG